MRLARVSNAFKLRLQLEAARVACQRIAWLRQGLRKDGTLPTSGYRRRIGAARRKRLAGMAAITARELLAADAALAKAMENPDGK